MRRVRSKELLLKERCLLLRAEAARLKAQEEEKSRKNNVIYISSFIKELQCGNVEEKEARKVLSL